MFNKYGLLAVSFLLLLIVPFCANSADSVVIDGDLKISGTGSLVFPDGSMQYSATVQGPKGDTGPQGPAGPAGPSYSMYNYYALGDSITHGSGSYSGNYSYVDALDALLMFNSVNKLGVNGATAKPTAGRGELADQVNAIGAYANIITVLIGVNDYILGNTLGDVDAVLAKPYASLDKSLSFAEAFRFCLETIKRNHEQARIYVILPLQTTWAGPVPLDQFRTAEIKIANYLSVPVLHANTESGLWTGGTLIPDGLHPNDTGYNILAQYIARKINSL